MCPCRFTQFFFFLFVCMNNNALRNIDGHTRAPQTTHLKRTNERWKNALKMNRIPVDLRRKICKLNFDSLLPKIFLFNFFLLNKRQSRGYCILDKCRRDHTTLFPPVVKCQRNDDISTHTRTAHELENFKFCLRQHEAKLVKQFDSAGAVEREKFSGISECFFSFSVCRWSMPSGGLSSQNERKL